MSRNQPLEAAKAVREEMRKHGRKLVYVNKHKTMYTVKCYTDSAILDMLLNGKISRLLKQMKMTYEIITVSDRRGFQRGLDSYRVRIMRYE